MSSACSWDTRSRRGLGASGRSPSRRRTSLTRDSISAAMRSRSPSPAVTRGEVVPLVPAEKEDVERAALGRRGADPRSRKRPSRATSELASRVTSTDSGGASRAGNPRASRGPSTPPAAAAPRPSRPNGSGTAGRPGPSPPPAAGPPGSGPVKATAGAPRRSPARDSTNSPTPPAPQLAQGRSRTPAPARRHTSESTSRPEPRIPSHAGMTILQSLENPEPLPALPPAVHRQPPLARRAVFPQPRPLALGAPRSSTDRQPFISRSSTIATMRLRLLRNATQRLRYARRELLLDPYFAPKHSRPSFTGRSPNPLVDLPCSPEEIMDGAELLIVSHLHSDHFDPEAQRLLPKDLPVLCQPGDEDASAATASRARPRWPARSRGTASP